MKLDEAQRAFLDKMQAAVTPDNIPRELGGACLYTVKSEVLAALLDIARMQETRLLLDMAEQDFFAAMFELDPLVGATQAEEVRFKMAAASSELARQCRKLLAQRYHIDASELDGVAMR